MWHLAMLFVYNMWGPRHSQEATNVSCLSCTFWSRSTPLGDISRPILLSFQQISAQGLNGEIDWVPCLTGDVVTLDSIHQVSALECQSRNLLVPQADRAHGWLGTQQQRHVAPGAYIPIWWDLRWNADPEPAPRRDAIHTPVDPHDLDDLSLLQKPFDGQQRGNDQEEDELSLMQRSASRSPRRTIPGSATSSDDENRVPVHTFRMSASYRKVVLERSQEMTYIPQLTRLWQVPPHNPLLAVHQVWHGPADLESDAKATLLLELASDRNRQAIADDQMVLVDVALESLGDSTTIRRVLWTRRFMTRPSFLHLLSVQEFCNSPATDCHVEKNKVTWHEQDTLSREFRSGDYVRLLVRGPTTMTPAEVQVVLCEQEGADAQRYLYTRSPSHSPEPSARSAEGAESESEIFQDSPVENHTSPQPEEEKGPLHEWTNRNLAERSDSFQDVPVEKAWGQKGKEHRRQVGGKENVHLSQGHPVRYPHPVLKPHVTDRWCASPGVGDRSLGSPGVKGSPITLALDELIPNDCVSLGQKGSVAYKPVELAHAGSLPSAASLNLQEDETNQCSRRGQLSVSCSAVTNFPNLQALGEKICANQHDLENEINGWSDLDEDTRSQLAQALNVAKSHIGEMPTRIAIYTDGSKLWNTHRAEDAAAWAFVFLAYWRNEQNPGLVGHLSGSLQLDGHADSWAGATMVDSFQAEVEAMIFAHLWFAQADWAYCAVPCEFVGDASAVLGILTGQFSMQHPHYTGLLRPLHKYVSSVTSVTTRWQKAHSGEPYNELADHLAKVEAASNSQTFRHMPIHPVHDRLGLAWLWQDAVSEDGGPSFANETMYIPMPQVLKASDLQEVSIDAVPQQRRTLNLRVISCNINSFKDSKRTKEITWSARSELVKQQILALQAQVVTWQETRRSTGGMWQDSHFIGFEHPADKGKGGVAVWFRKDVPFLRRSKHTQEVFFTANNIAVAFASAELMVIRYTSPEWKAVFVTAHAPTDTSTHKEKDEFWVSVEEQLAVFDGWEIIIGFDANSRLGDQALPHAGDFYADLPNDNGDRFLQFLRRQRLALPSTFRHFAKDPLDQQGTWLAKNGWKRIDYICTPLHWLQVATCSACTISLEKEVSQDDHKAVLLDIQVGIRAPATKEAVEHARNPVSVHRLMSREGQATCRHILKQMKWERPPWHASADEHAVFLQTRATELMTQAFPKQRRAPKPSWIQDDTWDTISHSRRARRHLQKLKEFHRAGLLGAILRAWRDRTIHLPGHFRRWVREHDHAAAYQLHVLRHSRTARARCLARDQSVYLDNLAVKQKEDLSEAKGTELWKKLRFQLPKFRHRIKRPLPHCGAQDAFLEHFADIEEAQITELKTLAVDASVKSYQGLCASLTIEMKAVDLPTIFELEEAIRSIACRKSSLGAFPIELMRADPALSAEILMPLMLDFFKHFQQPITWKGGSYYPLFKGKGSYQLPGNFRAILIAYSVPKLFHRIVRARLARQVAPQMLPFQIGGIKQMSVHFAVQFLNELRARSNRNKCSSAVLFFDLKSAFYRAQRSRIVDDVLHYDRGEDEDITLDQLGKPPALDDLQVPVSLQGVVQEIFTNSWNTVIAVGQDRSEKVMVSRRGTRPGDPIADLAFTCTMRSVLQQFMEAAQQVLPLFAVDQTQKRTPAITWVDDVAIFLEDECADTLVAKVRQTVAIMHAKCRSHGLDLNFAKGKTEAMFRFQGRNAVQWRQQLYLDQKLNLGEGFWQHIDIPVTSKYTHLGVVHASNCSHEPELSYRLGRARAALQECRKQILQQKAIRPGTRWQLAKSLVLSRLFYAAEVWPVLTSTQMHKIHNFVMKVARVILGCENYAGTQHWTDSHIAAQLPIPAVEDILASARLRYFARVWAVGPVELRQLLIQQDEQDNDAWLQRLRLDMVWLQSKVPNLKYLPAPTVDFEAWIQKASGMQEWHAMVGQALQAATIQRHYAAKHHQWKLKLQEILRTVGFNFHEASAQKPVQPHACHLCEARFSSYKALTVHHYKQHGRHAAERLYMEGTVCFSCLKDFHTTQRLRQHLQWKPDQCLHHLQQVLEPFAYTDVPLKDSLKTAHRVPAIRLAGPRLPTAEEWRQAKPDKTLPLSLEGDTESGGQEEVADGSSTGEDDQDREHPVEDGILALAVEAVCEEHEPWTPPHPCWWHTKSAFNTLVEFARLLHDDIIAKVDFAYYYEVHQWTEGLLAEHFAARRTPMDVVDHDRHPFPRGESMAEQATEVKCWATCQFVTIPRPLPGTASTHYILYAFSGHRRPGDMVEWAERLGQRHGIHLEVVTLDIVYDDSLCNLRDEGACHRWCRHLREGRFVAAVGAPPCETWSVARLRAWLAQDGGPAPVRTIDEPWGMKNNSLRLQRQVDCANDLMHTWMTFMALSLCSHTPFLMEHPAPSLKYVLAASIWRTEELGWFKLVEEVRETLIFQGRFGAVAAKPTHLLTFDLPFLPQALARWEDKQCDASRWIELKGKDSSGNFLTAQAKEYPPRLNAAIIDAIALGIVHAPLATQVLMPPPDESFLSDAGAVLMAQKVSGTERGPDYAPHQIWGEAFVQLNSTCKA